MLKVCNIKKTYKKPPVTALAGVSLEVMEGEVVGLLGPNGSGKTTLIKIINGIILQDSGEIYIGGRPVKNSREFANFLGSVFDTERSLSWGLTVRQNLMYFAHLKGAASGEVKAKFEYLGEIFDLKELWDRRVATLSHGQRQRAAIATALAHDPKILILDEPTNGLDVENTIHLSGIIRSLLEKKLSILISSHNLGFIEEVADRVYLMKQGRVVGNVRLEEPEKQEEMRYYHIYLSYDATHEDARKLELAGFRVIDISGAMLKVEVPQSVPASRILEVMSEIGLIVRSVLPVKRNLMELYRRVVLQNLPPGEVDVNESASRCDG
ncbi:ABC transporter ATP-binding protein [Thermosediminibacter oceani]|uniref:ABC transporter related protein n=1 Tax=Thermosediminibacter oceani (strain ATCC BAA-1034 / DSM 16646 / JW/IW-1228P) TaxID=555079 RepID=D9S0B4_THEOJ|nr:ABC transporter ATP-binding protein [Thermosediminibacter oceani]ADL07042.1 ABC transporter related protein [Thermosediminibacter oceani DSM 16646]